MRELYDNSEKDGFAWYPKRAVNEKKIAQIIKRNILD
jgi:hypothetical protein